MVACGDSPTSVCTDRLSSDGSVSGAVVQEIWQAPEGSHVLLCKTTM